MSREATLKAAKAALSRGSYRECLSVLESLMQNDSLLSNKNAEIGTLIITALIGQGENQKAIAICEILSKHEKDSIRQQAKQYISILKSPELEKPDNWSITMPRINIQDELTSFQKTKSPKIKEETISPPTGSTKSLSPGFTLLSLVIILLLTFLLSGCVKFNTKIEVTGPDRLKLSLDIESNSNKLTPWQEKFQSSLNSLTPKVSVVSDNEGKQIIKAPSLSSKNANILLKKTIAIAANKAGITPPPTNIHLAEKNWLIGIEQNLDLEVDLSDLPEVPGLKLAILIPSSPNTKISTAKPSFPILVNKNLNWSLQPGSVNTLSLHKWQWSRIGLGTLIILVIMSISIILQYVKLQMGLGFPELPP